MNRIATFPGLGRYTAAGGTAFVALIPPLGTGKTLFSMGQGTNQKRFGGGLTVVTKVVYSAGATAHQIGIMRPFNRTYLTAATAANGTVINLAADPGAYSTAWGYDSPNSKPANVANNTIAGSDYVVVQLVDGTWHVSIVDSVSSLAVTLTTALPNITGGGAAEGALCYFFGVIGDSNPQTGVVNPQVTIQASMAFGEVEAEGWKDETNGIVAALNEGDPLLFYSPNGTNAGVLESLSGRYEKP